MEHVDTPIQVLCGTNSVPEPKPKQLLRFKKKHIGNKIRHYYGHKTEKTKTFGRDTYFKKRDPNGEKYFERVVI